MGKISRAELLSKLPKDQNRWITIADDQVVDDIITEVLDAHEYNERYYDKIAQYFNKKSVPDICDALANFCYDEIKYKEESTDDQTTAVPQGILTRGFGDCKHYASLCGGILSALQRQGRNIDWSYRFASYKPLDKTPHHVFIVVFYKGEEIWIDPTPKANQLTPVWIVDGEPKIKNMALRRQIAGLHDENYIDFEDQYMPAIGKASATIVPTTGDTINFDGSGKYAGAFGPHYLGLSNYRDFTGDRNINEDSIASQLNALIAQGPNPGHTVNGEFVKWIFDNNVRSWNFYYPGGVMPGYNAHNILPAGWPSWVITPDGRLNFDEAHKDFFVEDDKPPNAEVHLFNAWGQAMLNENDPSSYPLKPKAIQEFSEGKEGNHDQRNLMTQARGDSIFKQVGKALEDTVNFVKDGVLKIAGSIPRNAFLGLVGINAFNFAGSMWRRINEGQWDEMAKKWEAIGGNPDKLRNTIEDGKDKKAILGQAGAIGEPVTVTTFLASAAPIIAVMLKFLDKDGKVTEALSAAKTALQVQYPGLDLDAYGFLDARTGMPIQWQIDDVDNENFGGGNNQLPKPYTDSSDIMGMLKANPVPVAAVAALGAHLFLNRKGRKKNLLIPLIVGGATYYMLSRGSSYTPATSSNKRTALLQKMLQGVISPGDVGTITTLVNTQFTDQEVSDVYDLYFAYGGVGASVPEGPLRSRLIALSTKYNIFT